MLVSVGALKVFDELALIPDVIAGGDDVYVEFEEFVDDLRSDAESGGGVFAIDDEQIGPFSGDQVFKAFFNNSAAGTAKNVSDEKNTHPNSMVSRYILGFDDDGE